MVTGHAVRVRVAAPHIEARRLCARLTRGGIAASPDDGAARAEVIVAIGLADLSEVRGRAGVLCVVGSPGAPLFTAGADDVVPPGEPELLFRRIRALIERADLVSRVERITERMSALESGLADAAHDLRSPLHTAIGNAELLSRDEELQPRHRQMAAVVVRQAERAVQLAERILENARHRDRSALDLGTIDLGKLVESAALRAQVGARAHGVTVNANPPHRPVELRADEELLARLLDNLIANAVRASPKGASVEVCAWRASPKLVRLAVKDSGEGIAAAKLPKLTAGLGPGRGLRIAREVAERHGGDLWAESTPGNGSRFFVELPLTPPSSRPRVLLVSNDNRWVREVSRTLREACDVRSTSLSAARLGTRRTDLVLVEAPEKGHARNLAALRTAAKGARVPVIELPIGLATSRLARLVQLAV